ncbi:MAG: DoxX family protein [Acidobacteriaceae bacterium]
MNGILACHRGFRRAVSSLQSPLLLLVRLYWGWQFIQTGSGKIHNITHVTGYFTELGVPAPHATAIFIAWLEFIGGILLIAGLFSRITSLALFIDMLIAYIVGDHAALVSFFSDPGTFYAAAPFTFMAASLLILIFGPGLFAFDTLLARMAPPEPRRRGGRM